MFGCETSDTESLAQRTPYEGDPSIVLNCWAFFRAPVCKMSSPWCLSRDESRHLTRFFTYLGLGPRMASSLHSNGWGHHGPVVYPCRKGTLARTLKSAE